MWASAERPTAALLPRWWLTVVASALNDVRSVDTVSSSSGGGGGDDGHGGTIIDRCCVLLVIVALSSSGLVRA
eukprot:COSAG02_NODE_15198_length_1194_cov_1.251142_1_plen_72_part_10